MLKSLNSGVSGIKVNQQRLDVIGNNIANVGTTAFKGSTVNFQNMLSQSITGTQAASANQGGVNGSQIGLGVKLGAVVVNQSQGSMISTSSVTDIAVDGNGYFLVEKGPILNEPALTPIVVDAIGGTETSHKMTSIDAATRVLFTRDGSFTRDNDGNLVTTDGLRVLGYSVQGFMDDPTVAAAGVSIIPNSTNPLKSDSNFVSAKNTVTADGGNLLSMIIPDTVIKDGISLKVTKTMINTTGLIIVTLDDGTQSAVGQIAMASFKNPNGLRDLGGNLSQETSNSGTADIMSGLGITNIADDNSKGYGSINSGFLEASNIDIAQQFTDMIVSTRAFEASGKMITNGDELLQTIIGLKR